MLVPRRVYLVCSNGIVRPAKGAGIPGPTTLRKIHVVPSHFNSDRLKTGFRYVEEAIRSYLWKDINYTPNIFTWNLKFARLKRTKKHLNQTSMTLGSKPSFSLGGFFSALSQRQPPRKTVVFRWKNFTVQVPRQVQEDAFVMVKVLAKDPW